MLLNCKECSTPVSTKAKACLKCGAKAPKEPLSTFNKIFLVFGIGFFGFIIYRGVHAPEKSTAAEKAVRNVEQVIQNVAYTCGYSIKERLNDPDSAKFYYDHINAVPKIEGGRATWIVQVPVRARNQFNALVFGLFECEVKKIDHDKWQTLSIIRIE